MQLTNGERLIRSLIALAIDGVGAMALVAFFDHVWWLEAVRSLLGAHFAWAFEFLIFLFLWRFISCLLMAKTPGQYLAGLGVYLTGIKGRILTSGACVFEFIFFFLSVLNLYFLTFKKRSLSELVLGDLIRVQSSPHWKSLLLLRVPALVFAYVIVLLMTGIISRFFDVNRTKSLEENPFVVTYQAGTGTTYSSNRFRMSFTTQLRDNLGVRRVSLIPSFEVVRSLGKKLFYPGLVFFDRDSKGFARLGLYKEVEYEHLFGKALAFMPPVHHRYERLLEILKGKANFETSLQSRELQNFLMDIFEFDHGPLVSIVDGPFYSRFYSRALFDLFKVLEIDFSPKVSRMSLANESFIRLEGRLASGEREEYWLSTKGPKMRVFKLEIGRDTNWKTEEILPILFKDAKWDWQADLAFPIALLKDTVNAVSVVDLFTKTDLKEEEKSVIEEFLFFHFFELARDSIIFKQEELQKLLSDTIERFLVIASHKVNDNQMLYSGRFQKNLKDLNLSLEKSDKQYFGIDK